LARGSGGLGWEQKNLERSRGTGQKEETRLGLRGHDSKTLHCSRYLYPIENISFISMYLMAVLKILD
jgi:hypothetical protein